jgi:hypothetical protein
MRVSSREVEQGKKYIAEVLEVMTTMKADGTYPWERFSVPVPNQQGSVREYAYASFDEYLEQWAGMTISEARELFADRVKVLRLLDAMGPKERAQA